MLEFWPTNLIGFVVQYLLHWYLNENLTFNFTTFVFSCLALYLSFGWFCFAFPFFCTIFLSIWSIIDSFSLFTGPYRVWPLPLISPCAWALESKLIYCTDLLFCLLIYLSEKHPRLVLFWRMSMPRLVMFADAFLFLFTTFVTLIDNRWLICLIIHWRFYFYFS